MKTITFDGHMRVPQRQVTLTQAQLYEVFEAMKDLIVTHTEFATFKQVYRETSPADDKICAVCEQHDVDWRYKKDRVAFLKAVVDSMENPYS